VPSVCASLATSGTHLADGPRLLKIDDQSRPDHSRLTSDDECFYFYEYTSGKNYTYSETNSLISNLKKKRGAPGYAHKLVAIETVAQALAGAINRAWLDGATLVPVPPSKAKGDAQHDDRMVRICDRIARPAVRELVIQGNSLPTAHESQQRPSRLPESV
jgi:hypothetical protein